MSIPFLAHDTSKVDPLGEDFYGYGTELRPLTCDTIGFALAINEKREVVGSRGTCANTAVAANGLVQSSHAVLRQNGVPTYLGSLGIASLAAAINNRSEV